MFKWAKKRFIRWIIKELYTMEIQYTISDGFVCIPHKEISTSAGWDIVSTKDIAILPGEKVRIKVGFETAFSAEFELCMRTKSSICYDTTLHQTTSTIDSCYRQQMHVILRNYGNESVSIKRGQKVSQLIAHRVAEITWQKVTTLPPSKRIGGFGSTGQMVEID